MKKRILAALSALLIASTLSGTVVFAQDIPNNLEQAESSEDFTTIVDLNQCTMYRQLPDGTILPVSTPYATISSHTIEAGETMYYFGSDGYDFYIYEGSVVSFQATFGGTSSYECGLCLDGTLIPIKSGRARSFSINHTVEEEGWYQFYITNDSSEAITVKSGAIRF
jgi:hypothetical protein